MRAKEQRDKETEMKVTGREESKYFYYDHMNFSASVINPHFFFGALNFATFCGLKRETRFISLFILFSLDFFPSLLVFFFREMEEGNCSFFSFCLFFFLFLFSSHLGIFLKKIVSNWREGSGRTVLFVKKMLLERFGCWLLLLVELVLLL